MKKQILAIFIICTVLFSCMGTALAWDEVFVDDFSSGNLDKWTGYTAFPVVDGMVGMNVFNVHLVPKDFEPSKNIMIQFDGIGWMGNFYVQFTDPEDEANSFRCTLHPYNINSWAQLWDFGDVWVNYANNCGVDGGTVAEPKITGIRYILTDGVLSVYLKKESDADFVYKGSHSYEANDGVISKEASYVPRFYVIGSQDPSKAEEFKIDNVVIKTLKPFEPTLSSEVIDTRPGALFTVEFPYALEGLLTNSNVELQNKDGAPVDITVVPVTPAKYKIVLAGDTWLTQGEKFRLVFKNLKNIHGQKLTEKTIEISAAVYNTNFTIGEISKVVGESKTPLASAQQGTYTLSAKLLPNNPGAASADIAIMVCKGTEQCYSISDIHYYNSVLAFGEKPAEITVGEGEFLKFMAFNSFADSRLAANSVILAQ